MKNLRITVNGKTYDVQVEELSEGSSASVPAAPAPAAAAAPAPAAQPAQAAPAAQAPAAAPAASADGEEILCPMPGTILSINVKAGEKISEGDVIVVFEAGMATTILPSIPWDNATSAICSVWSTLRHTLP